VFTADDLSRTLICEHSATCVPCSLITPQSPLFLAPRPRHASFRSYLISFGPLASVHYKAVRYATSPLSVWSCPVHEQSRPASHTCMESDDTLSLIPRPTVAQSRAISQLGRFIKPITRTLNNAECTLYLMEISLFCDRE